MLTDPESSSALLEWRTEWARLIKETLILVTRLGLTLNKIVTSAERDALDCLITIALICYVTFYGHVYTIPVGVLPLRAWNK